MTRPLMSLLLVCLAAFGVLAAERGAATTPHFGSDYFPEGSVGRKFVVAEFSFMRSWTYADSYADSSIGTSLASIVNQEEQDAVEALLDALGLSSVDRTYFGGRFDDLACNIAHWVDGEAWTGYTNWATGQPSNFSTQRVLMLNSGDQKWRTIESTTAFGTAAVFVDPAYAASVPMSPIPVPLTAPLLLGALGGVFLVG